jgi:hypothetical protein
VCITKFLGVPTKLFVNFMAPLKLLENCKVKALFNNHNATNGGKFVFDPNLITSSSCAPLPLCGLLKTPIIISLNSMQVGGVGSLEVPINLESDSTQTSTSVEPLTNKQCKNYDATQKWQDSWVIQFFKMVDGMLVHVECIVCETIID